MRHSDWTVAPIPADLADRRVEITGPVDRKMIINALNSGAQVFMADFEDASSPTWSNMVEGQANLIDAVARTIELEDSERGKHYSLNDEIATLLVRPAAGTWTRSTSWSTASRSRGSLFDFGLYFFHNAAELIARGTAPYFYLPKLESHLEARLWNDVFVAAQEALGIPHGTIRATVLIETILAAFEMDEILYELRDHSAGTQLRSLGLHLQLHQEAPRPPRVRPADRASRSGWTGTSCIPTASCSIQTCHRRRIHAMGGMAAQIPIKGDAAANDEALREGARRQAARGHRRPRRHLGRAPGSDPDGQGRVRPGHEGREPDRRATANGGTPPIGADDLLDGSAGQDHRGRPASEPLGRRALSRVLAARLGCVPLFNLMEDAATAEISRTQVWQWVRHGARLEDGQHGDLRARPRLPARRSSPSPSATSSETSASSSRVASRWLAGLFRAPGSTTRTSEEFLTLAYAYIHL